MVSTAAHSEHYMGEHCSIQGVGTLCPVSPNGEKVHCAHPCTVLTRVYISASCVCNDPEEALELKSLTVASGCVGTKSQTQVLGKGTCSQPLLLTEASKLQTL